MRLTELRIASTCSWLALISSSESAPVLAASLVSAWISSSSDETSLSAPSAVLITLLARVELSMACPMPLISLRSVSLAIRAVGASLPVLIFNPLERRCSRVERSVLFLFRRLMACRDEMLLLILLIVSSVIPCKPGGGDPSPAAYWSVVNCQWSVVAGRKAVKRRGQLIAKIVMSRRLRLGRECACGGGVQPPCCSSKPAAESV